MATSQINRIVENLRHTVLARDGANLSDGQLLDCFVARREESAFEILVRRHGPMVLSVCRRVVGNHHDAEDAFQATFLVLVRKAASIQPRELVGNWLYGVAYQTSLRAKTIAAKRGAREKQVTYMPEAEAVTQGVWRDLQPLLDQELSRLSDKYRVPIVLCDLEGKTRKEAAQHLGVPEGTISSRLARARMMLAKRLTRHGVTLSAGALAAVLTQQGAAANVPATLVCGTLQAAEAFAAGGIVSAEVALLTEGVLKAMLMTKLRTMALVFGLVFSLLGAGLLLHSALAGRESDGGVGVFQKSGTSKKVKNTTDADLLGSWHVVSVQGDTKKADWAAKAESLTFQDSGWIYSPIPGQIKEIPAGLKTGSIVARGQPLFVMFDSELEKQVNDLQTEIDILGTKINAPAPKNADPAKNEGADPIAIEEANITRRKKIEMLKRLKDRTNADLARPGVFTISAPVAGVILSTDFRENLIGRVVRPSDLLLRIARTQEVNLSNRVAIQLTSGSVEAMDYAITTSARPNEVNFLPIGAGDGKVIRAIYQIDGSKLKICASAPNLVRPKDFDFKQGVLLVLRRVKKADGPVIREIDLNGYRGEQPKNDFAKPTQIKSVQELAKAFPDQEVGLPDKEWREKIASQVDFTKEHLLFFAWSGSRYDRILIRGEKTKQVVFRRRPGVTNDAKPHIHLYAISKDASWSIETGVQSPDEKLKEETDILKRVDDRARSVMNPPIPPEDKLKNTDPERSKFDMAVQWPGASAEEMERLVIPLELELAQRPGVKSIRTRSQAGWSQLRVEWNLP